MARACHVATKDAAPDMRGAVMARALRVYHVDIVDYVTPCLCADERAYSRYAANAFFFVDAGGVMRRVRVYVEWR